MKNFCISHFFRRVTSCTGGIFATFAFATIALGLAAYPNFSQAQAQEPSPALEPIRIGQFACLTGDKATYGTNCTRGVQLAVEQLNAAGGVLGRPIKLITEDDQSKAGQPAVIVKKLISNDNVCAIIGEFPSSLSLEAAPICQNARIPLVSPGTTSPIFTEKGDYMFRVCYIDPFQGIVMAKFALETLKINKVAIFTAVNQDYSIGLSKYFKEYFTQHGGTVVAERSYSSGDKDFRAQLTAIKSAHPDAIFTPGYYTEGGLIARQARSLGLNVPLLGGDGWDSPKIYEIGGDAMSGSFFSTHFAPTSEATEVRTFVERFKNKFGEIPDATSALGYDCVMVIADAIARAGTTQEPALRDALAATQNFKTVTGNISFDSERNVTKPAVILKIDDHKFDYVTTVQPETQ